MRGVEGAHVDGVDVVEVERLGTDARLTSDDISLISDIMMNCLICINPWIYDEMDDVMFVI